MRECVRACVRSCMRVHPFKTIIAALIVRVQIIVSRNICQQQRICMDQLQYCLQLRLFSGVADLANVLHRSDCMRVHVCVCACVHVCV